jgi:drug/metabolite transporter (DMT)-like permease
VKRPAEVPTTGPGGSAFDRGTIAWMAVGVLSISLSSVLVRLADAPALSTAFYRNAFAAAILVPIALVRDRRAFAGLTRRRWTLAVAAGVVLAAHFSTWIPSLDYISIAASTVIVTTQPVWVAIGERVLGRPVGRGVVLGIALSLTGALVIFWRDLGTTNLTGDVLALLGAWFGAAYLLTGRTVRQEVPLLTYVGIAYTVAAICLAGVVAVAGQPFTGFDARVWLLFVAMAIVPQIGGHTVFNYLLSKVRPSAIAITITLEPVGASLLALLLFQEVPPWTAVVGGALILAGVVVTIRAQPASEVPVETPVE